MNNLREMVVRKGPHTVFFSLFSLLIYSIHEISIASEKWLELVQNLFFLKGYSIFSAEKNALNLEYATNHLVNNG